MTATFGCVVLTQGRRPDDLQRAVTSLRAQRDVLVDIVVVGNGCVPDGVPPGVRTVALEQNIGATAGRNVGVPHVTGDLLLFLDDDAALPHDDALSRMAQLFARDASLGVVQPRVVDPQGRPGQRRHVPRLVAGDPSRSSDVTSFWEGAVAIRRSAFDAVGGFDEPMWYAHEGLDLGWRLVDAGWRVHYAGSIIANHPAMAIPPHGSYRYITARNRVWVVRRHLPWPVAVVHLGIWFLATLARVRTVEDLRQTLRGWRDGFIEPAGERRPMSWRTMWTMTRLGRPPII